jgi:citrate lyase subunit beta/citryl-CoA lyase
VILPARSYLFVPGNRPDRFGKALASGADRIILDLEDALAPAEKPQARVAIAQWLAANPAARARAVLRVNDVTTEWHADDMALAGRADLSCVMLPKCESAGQVDAVRLGLGSEGRVLPLIETARGVQAVQAISQADGVERLAFGSLDYAVDLDLPEPADPDGPPGLALDLPAAAIALASRAAGLPAPVAGVTPAIDPKPVERDMRHMHALGFGAKMCIHPAQVAAVHAALRPTADQQAWAQRVLAAWRAGGGGVLQVDGQMVDKPVILRARRIAALAGDDAIPGSFPA